MWKAWASHADNDDDRDTHAHIGEQEGKNCCPSETDKDGRQGPSAQSPVPLHLPRCPLVCGVVGTPCEHGLACSGSQALAAGLTVVCHRICSDLDKQIQDQELGLQANPSFTTVIEVRPYVRLNSTVSLAVQIVLLE